MEGFSFKYQESNIQQSKHVCFINVTEAEETCPVSTLGCSGTQPTLITPSRRWSVALVFSDFRAFSKATLFVLLTREAQTMVRALGGRSKPSSPHPVHRRHN